MIDVVICLNEKGGIGWYRVKGHSEEALCAAVSCLSQSVYLALEELHSATIKNAECGLFEVLVTRDNKNTRAILQVLKLGLIDLAKQYPKEISVRYF